MRKHLFVILALLLASGTACQQKETLPEETTLPEPEKKVVITASFANPTSRITYTEDAETHKLHQEWEVGDMLYGYSFNNNEYLPLTLKVTAVDSETGVATLDVEDGCSLPQSGTIHMIYSADRNVDQNSHLLFDDGFPVAINLCYQVAATGTTVPAILTANAAVTDSEINLVFESQTAILGIKGFHGLAPGATVSSFRVSGVNNCAYFPYNDENLGLSPYMYSEFNGSYFYTQDFIVVEKPGGWTADENGVVDETFYVAVFPNSELTEISLVAYDSQNNEYRYQLGSKNIAAGKYYYMNNKQLLPLAAYVYINSSCAEVSSIEEAFALAKTATGDCFIYLNADCAATADLSLANSSTRGTRDLSTVHVTLDLSGHKLDMNGHSICAGAAGASLEITNTYGTGILLQEADVPLFVVSDGTITVRQEEEYDYYGTYCYNVIIKCTSNATGYSPMVVTGGELHLEGGYYFFNTTARLINSTDATFATVYKDCYFNKNPGFTASSCTLEPDHMIGKAKPVTVDGITYNYRYVDRHAAYDSNDERFKHFTINENGDVAYLSKFNLQSDGSLMDLGWDYTPDESSYLNYEQYEAAAENGYPSLSEEEWTYLLNARTASTINDVENARFVKCTFDTKRGLLIFPDDFVWPGRAGSAPDASAINNASANYDTTIPRQYANELIYRGCVFLQADGFVTGGNVRSANVAGNYWTSTTKSTSQSYILDFGSFQQGQSASYELKTTYIPNSDCISVRPYFK